MFLIVKAKMLEQNNRNFADDIFEYIFDWKLFILFKMSPKTLTKNPINNKLTSKGIV